MGPKWLTVPFNGSFNVETCFDYPNYSVHYHTLLCCTTSSLVSAHWWNINAFFLSTGPTYSGLPLLAILGIGFRLCWLLPGRTDTNNHYNHVDDAKLSNFVPSEVLALLLYTSILVTRRALDHLQIKTINTIIIPSWWVCWWQESTHVRGFLRRIVAQENGCHLNSNRTYIHLVLLIVTFVKLNSQ